MVLPQLISLKHRDVNDVVTDLSEDFFTAPIFTDTGSGEANVAIIVISGDNGKYITQQPIIDGYDRIQFQLNDEDGTPYSKTFEVILVVPVQTKSSGTKVELHLIGSEHNFQKINFTKPFYGSDVYSVQSDIANYYNTQIGTKQPKIVNINTTNLAVPTWTVNNYDYGLNQETCYNRAQQTNDKMGNSVAGGGIVDYFDIFFSTIAAFNTTPQMTMNIQSSGSTPTNPIQITNTTSVNVGPTEGGIQAPRGTLVCGWGDADSGSLPVDFSRWVSQEEMWGLHPTWTSGIAYPVDSLVQLNGAHYHCNAANTSSGGNQPPNAFFWDVITPGSWYGNSSLATFSPFYPNPIVYSPFTRNIQSVWKLSGQNPLDTGGGVKGIGFYDSNMVVWDDNSLRTVVDCTATQSSDITSSSLAHLLYSGTDFYRGFRVLVNTASPGSPWTGTDQYGVSYANQVVEYDGSKWNVKYSGLKQTGSMVCSLMNGANYKWGGSSWTDVSSSANGNDCFHPYFNFSNIPGIYAINPDGFGGATDTSFTANTNSAIRVEYDYFIPVDSTTKNWYQIGAFLNFSVPYPYSTFGGIGQAVGQYYGGAKQSGGVPDSDKEPATIDVENMHLTHDGYRGFNRASSWDLGNISSLDFYLRIWYQAPTSLSGGNPDWSQPVYNIQSANFQMRCAIYDTSDNVVYQDFQIPFFGNWTPIKLPLSGFQLYRARRPVNSVFQTIIPPKSLDANNVFEWRNVKRIVIQTQDSFDSNGRYLPYDAVASFGVGNKWVAPIVNDAASGLPIDPIFSLFRRIFLDLDAFRFTKVLFTTSGVVTDRDIQTDFVENSLLTLFDNLQNEVNTQLAISKFRHVEYDLTTTGKFDISFSDSFYLLNPQIVPNRKSDGSPTYTGDITGHGDQPNGVGGYLDNTVKLVAKRIEYSITKPSDGTGGFLRKIVGIRRFTA